MAGPHVAGLVGLMISAVPAVAGDVDRLEDLIRDSAVHPTFGGQCGVTANVFPNNTFGAGRIDALAAVNLLLSQADFQVALTPASQAVCAPASALFDVAVGQLGSFRRAGDPRGRRQPGRLDGRLRAQPGDAARRLDDDGHHRRSRRRQLADHRHRHLEPERRRARRRRDAGGLHRRRGSAGAQRAGERRHQRAGATDFHLDCGGGRRRLSARGR